MRIRLLLDENLSPRLKLGFARRLPAFDVLRIGDEGAPPLGTPDPDILHYLEQNQRVLVTDNRQSMQGHIAAHHAAGHRHWGIFVVRKNVPFGRLIDELVLYREASEAEEWIDRIEWLAV